MSGVRLYIPEKIPPADHREILRYAGVRGDAPELFPLLRDCLAELLPRLSYRAVWTELPLEEDHTYGFAERLRGCESVILMVATVGLAPDRAVARYGHTEPSRALLCSAIGTERVEALCDTLCEELPASMAKEGKELLPRFSPGYGDCPLSLQGKITSLLDTPRSIGVCVGESLLLTPQKSVSAIVGVRKNKEWRIAP